MTDAATKRVRLTIRGHVQGVWFRASTRERALELGLTGWVRNVHDGTVQAEVQGHPEAIDTLVEFVHQGPPRADVRDVDATEVDPVAGEDSFTVR